MRVGVALTNGHAPLSAAGAELASLEATHESLIPLEEEEEEEGEGEGLEEVSAMDMEQRSNLLDQVVNLARDLGRSHRLRGNPSPLPPYG